MKTSILTVLTYLILIIDAAHCCNDNMLIYNAKLHKGIEMCTNEADELIWPEHLRKWEEEGSKTQCILY